MGFLINSEEWLEAQLLQVKAILRLRMVRDVEYSNAEMLDLMRSSGFEYTPAELAELRNALVEQGVLVEVE